MMRPPFAGIAVTVGLLAVLPSAPQTPRNKRSQSVAVLSKSVDWGDFPVRLFADDQTRLVFTLATSWIPGEEHKGMFRYRMSVRVDPAQKETSPSTYTPDKIESLMKRVDHCSITLVLYDADHFVLRKIPVSLGYGLNQDTARVVGLYANDSSQMDASEYSKFVPSGAWAAGFDCK